MIDTRLRDTVALVTGANQGIGAATASALAAEGARVFVHYLRLPLTDEEGSAQRTQDAAAVLQAIAEQGGQAAAVEMDLADPELVDLVEEEIRELLEKNGFDKDAPIIRGSATKALEGDAENEDKIMELVKAMDDFIPEPKRELDKPFLMPVEDIFSISGRGTVATGRVERGIVKKRERYCPLELEGAFAGEEHRARVGVDALDWRATMRRRVGEECEDGFLGRGDRKHAYVLHS